MSPPRNLPAPKGMKEGGRRPAPAAPCAGCKLLRRRCSHDCLFAPYFPADEPHKFASVHKVFGASNVNKMLQDLPEHHRVDAVTSMVYEANARVRDPVYGCVAAITALQEQVEHLQAQLALAKAEIIQLQMRHLSTASLAGASSSVGSRSDVFSMDASLPDDSLWSCSI